MTPAPPHANRRKWTPIRGVSWGGRLAGVIAAAVVLAPLGAALPAAAQTPAMVPVIVQASPGNLARVRADLTGHGGRIVLDLGIVNGFSAQLPASEVPVVAALPGVRAVSADSPVQLAGAAAPAVDPVAPYDPAKDPGSLGTTANAIGSDKLRDQAATGSAIGVALIDSGVTQVNGLASGNVVNGPDLSLDAGAGNLRSSDQFGHGTHMAGIIAGRDNGLSGKGAYGDVKNFVGIAPDATVINVKVGAGDGTVDASQVIAGLDWVVAHHNDPGLNIRVVNLSFGTDSTQDYRIDPLAYAAEAAWHAGIVVVAAAGNEGNQTAVMTDPATDPYVIAVGADDRNGKKLYVTSFSNSGDAARHPDVIAPGKSIVSLRDPGSLIDATHPEGLVNDPAGRFFRGSGTSQATAVVSGAAALLLRDNPQLTPDQVKGLLMANATLIPGVAATSQGSGAVNLGKLGKKDKVPAYTQTWIPANGTGSIEASRGGVHVTLNGQPLTGEATVFGAAFNGHSWSGNAWDAASWAGGSWSGHSWSGDTWTGHSWSSTGWSGHSWSADTWDGHSWSSGTWSGHSWSDAAWDGHSWSGDNWS